jgi:hypothetical protein
MNREMKRWGMHHTQQEDANLMVDESDEIFKFVHIYD